MNDKEIIIFKMKKIIEGSKSVVDAIDSGKDLNMSKCIRAAMINNIVIAESFKTLLQLKTESKKSENDFGNIFKDFFKNG